MQQRVLRAGFRILSRLSPGFAARLAERLWFRVPAPHISGDARAFLATGQPFTVTVDGRPVSCWRWGSSSSPTVLLMHGWGGNAGQFRAVVEAIVARGLGAVCFDALSHGHSAPGAYGPRSATLFEFALALRAVSREVPRLAGVVAHSGGCAAVAWEMRADPTWRPPRLVFVAPFGRMGPYLAQFQQLIGLSDEALRRFRGQAESHFKFRWEELEVPELAARMRTPPTLVVHDREDRETAWQDGADIAATWPDTRLISTTGLGHNRILRDPAVAQSIAEFLGQNG